MNSKITGKHCWQLQLRAGVAPRAYSTKFTFQEQLHKGKYSIAYFGCGLADFVDSTPYQEN